MNAPLQIEKQFKNQDIVSNNTETIHQSYSSYHILKSFCKTESVFISSMFFKQNRHPLNKVCVFKTKYL